MYRHAWHIASAWQTYQGEEVRSASASVRPHQAREATTAAGRAGAVSAKSSARGAALRAEAPLPRL